MTPDGKTRKFPGRRGICKGPGRGQEEVKTPTLSARGSSCKVPEPGPHGGVVESVNLLLPSPLYSVSGDMTVVHWLLGRASPTGGWCHIPHSSSEVNAHSRCAWVGEWSHRHPCSQPAPTCSPVPEHPPAHTPAHPHLPLHTHLHTHTCTCTHSCPPHVTPREH